ncbi:MAG: hypothetical protein J3R72DRAFT_441487 [Linnemannia gamsii]|nr:MAG: hypothetical protein J3R72DRAFT_441487 [Linnemannia gamsii]
MTSRRTYARTATDISLRPPQTQSFVDGSVEEFDLIHYEATGPGMASRGRLVPDPVHAVPYLTPHKVSVLILVEFFCQNRCPPDAAQQLLLFLLDCIQDSAEYLHRDVNEFGTKITTEAGPAVWSHLKDTLKRIKSPHHLSEFFMYKLEHNPMEDPQEEPARPIGLTDLIHDPKAEVVEGDTSILLEPSSVLGLYVRKARIEFRKLSFEEVCKYYTALEIYIAALDKQGRSPKHSPSDQSTCSQTSGGSALMSLFDVEKYLDVQTDNLSDPSQTSIPDELLAHVYEIQSRMPALAKTYYITCLHAQQTGDFEIAIQSLYRFFDYCISMHDQVLYQYALLNLAMLHARFSNYDQALIALEETIEMARSQLDQECLSYASNWLNRLTRTMPGSSSDGSKARMLADLAGDIDDQTSQYLTSLNELNNARQMQGESTPRALESLVKASSINMRYSLEGVGGVVQLFQSKIWGAYGNHPLSSLYSQLQLKYRPGEIDMGDATSGYTKHASDLTLHGHFEDALRVIEQAKTKFPLNTLKAAPWVQTLVQLLQRKALSSNNLRDAEIWTQQLGSTLVNTPRLGSSMERGPPNKGASNSANGAGRSSNGAGIDGSGAGMTRDSQLDDTSLELQLDILLQNALLSVLVGQRQSGVHQLSEGLNIVQQNQWSGTQKFTIMYLLALSEIYMESESAVSAVPLLLTAATLSENSFQRPLLLLVKLRLAEVLLYLDSVQQARDLVDSIMSMALNQGDMFVQALAYFQNAKCLLAHAHQKRSSSSSERRHMLQEVIALLKRALHGYRQLDSMKDVAQVLYFQTRVYRELGQIEDVEMSLEEFKTTNEKIMAAQNERAPSWFSYYYTRDAFDGLLRANELKNPAAAPLPRPSSNSNLLVGGSNGGFSRTASGLLGATGGGGLKRSGSSQWGGGLKRTSSQLWQSTVSGERTPILPRHDEEAMEEDRRIRVVAASPSELVQSSVEDAEDDISEGVGGGGVDGEEKAHGSALEEMMSPELVDKNAPSGPSQQKRRRFGSE